MLRAIRRWFEEESLGITIPAGVVLGLTTEMLIAEFVLGLEIAHVQNRPIIRPLQISPLGIDFNYQNFLPHAVSLIVLGIVAYVLFLMPIASDNEPEPDIRECRECKSDIFAEATRCAFCTSPVTPLDATARTP